MMESVASCRWDWVRFCRFGAMLLAAWRCMDMGWIVERYQPFYLLLTYLRTYLRTSIPA